MLRNTYVFLIVTLLFLAAYGADFNDDLYPVSSNNSSYSDDIETSSVTTDQDNYSEEQENTLPFWMETYGEGLYLTKSGLDASLFVKGGKRFNWPVILDIYGKMDITSGNPDYFWSNRANVGAGFRLVNNRFATIIGFGEFLAGQYFKTRAEVQKSSNSVLLKNEIDSLVNLITVYENAQRYNQHGAKPNYDSIFKLSFRQLQSLRDSLKRVDSLTNSSTKSFTPGGLIYELRYGLVVSKQWGEEYDGSAPIHFWGDFYSEAVGTLLKRKTYDAVTEELKDTTFPCGVLYVHPAIGIATRQTPLGSFILTLDAHYWIDTEGYWDQNCLMFGPAFHYRPFKTISMDINGGYLFGTYIKRKITEDPKPVKGIFKTVRLNLSFWYGAGL
jgi:hypothetical protein